MIEAISRVKTATIAGVKVNTMSSVDIATLTEKRHDNVNSDIEKMLVDLEIGVLKFQGTYKSLESRKFSLSQLKII